MISFLASQLSISESFIWYGLAFIGIVGSALYSGLETGVYTLNTIRLHVLGHEKGSSAEVLLKMYNKPGRLLGTLLIGNNVVNYAATFGIAVILQSYALSEWQSIAINALILTPLLFVFGEVLPKDSFANYADKWTYTYARFLRITQWALMLCLLLPLVDMAATIIGWLLGKRGGIDFNIMHPRHKMVHLAREGVGHGVISHEQSDIIDRVLNPDETLVKDAMTPWPEVMHVKVDNETTQLYDMADRYPWTRYPVMNEIGELVGVINILSVLSHKISDCPPISELMIPVETIHVNMPIRKALRDCQHRKITFAVVMDGDTPVGWITIKDLVEPVIGELAVW